MYPFATTVPTLAISMIYCIWRAYTRDQDRKRSRLCERVALMLWVAAAQMS